jgi:hypothetical protein
MDKELLLKAIENDKNLDIMSLTTVKINALKKKVIDLLPIEEETRKDYLSILKDYRFVDELDEFINGRYIRWVKLSNESNFKLERGAAFVEYKITKDDTKIIYKNFYTPKHFQLNFDDCIFFQKLSDQELIILKALDHMER